MQAPYQNGCLTTITRKDAIERGQFRWRARNPDGSLRPCKKTLGPVSEYPFEKQEAAGRVARPADENQYGSIGQARSNNGVGSDRALRTNRTSRTGR
jgi:hypothetical protein